MMHGLFLPFRFAVKTECRTAFGSLFLPKAIWTNSLMTMFKKELLAERTHLDRFRQGIKNLLLDIGMLYKFVDRIREYL